MYKGSSCSCNLLKRKILQSFKGQQNPVQIDEVTFCPEIHGEGGSGRSVHQLIRIIRSIRLIQSDISSFAIKLLVSYYALGRSNYEPIVSLKPDPQPYGAFVTFSSLVVIYRQIKVNLP